MASGASGDVGSTFGSARSASARAGGRRRASAGPPEHRRPRAPTPAAPNQERAITAEKTSPLVLDTHELGRRPGSMRTVVATVPAPADLGTAVIGIPEGSELELDLRLEAVMEGVLVSGTVTGHAVGECSRCLEEVREDVTVELGELFAYEERAKAAQDSGDDLEDAEDVYDLDGDLADIEPALRDSVVTALPFSPVCRPDCPGLCSECGARLADDPGHAHELADPRWSALESMFDTSNVSDETKES